MNEQRNGHPIAVPMTSRAVSDAMISERRRIRERFEAWVAAGRVIADDATRHGDATLAYELDAARAEIKRLYGLLDHNIQERAAACAERDAMRQLHRGQTTLVDVTLGKLPLLAPSRATGARLHDLFRVPDGSLLRLAGHGVIHRDDVIVGLFDGDSFTVESL